MLFRKTANNFLNKEISRTAEPPHVSAMTAPATTLTEEEEEFLSPSTEPEEIPDVYLGAGTSFQGDLEFPTLLRVDGKFQGKITSSGRIIVGPDGHVKADIRMAEAFISGKIEGDIVVQERLVLRGRAEVYGNITAPLLSVDEGVTIVGQLCVSMKKTDEYDET